MKKEETEQELIGFARLRWERIRGEKDYKEDFERFVKDNPKQKKNPLIIKNFEILENENFEKSVQEIIKKYDLDSRHPTPWYHLARRWGFCFQF
jgi:hypothetical protein